ncbi:MAG: hypothetical protein LBD11_02010 [Candidatus Peribacteria bacterium]|nr:hypothetical protein [Candidatus Peribacteria bacterium]
MENSLTTLEDCRNFREVIQHLSTIIGGKIQETPPEEIKDPLKEEHHEELNISKQQDEKLASASSLLGTLFNAQKRLQDRTDLKTQDGTNNGLYLFLKRATPQITDLNSTAEGEQQKINIKEISSYLAAIEQGKEKEYQGFIKRGLKG